MYCYWLYIVWLVFQFTKDFEVDAGIKTAFDQNGFIIIKYGLNQFWQLFQFLQK